MIDVARFKGFYYPVMNGKKLSLKKHRTYTGAMKHLEEIINWLDVEVIK